MSTAILMPALSPTMEEGTLAKWLVKKGDAVKAGDVIAEIETDKATMEVEAVDEGIVAEILVPAGTENVKVNTPIATLDGEGAAPPPPAPARAPAPAVTAAPAAPAPAKPAAPQAERPAPRLAPGPRLFASPLARRLAAAAGLDLAAVNGTGPGGRIVKADVQRAQAAAPAAPAAKPPAVRGAEPAPPPAAKAPPGLPDPRVYFAEGDYDAIPHDGMRKAIARRLQASTQTIPHYYLTTDIVLDALLALRQTLNAKAPAGEGSYKISVNDFIVRASALALMKVPACNVSWAEDAMLRHKHADIGVAVALDGGLITPIVRHAERKGLAEIAHEVADLAARARNRKLKPQDYEGGTFAISNLGMYGIKEFTAVINPPHAAILAVGRGEERPIVREGALARATVMTVTMSCDHRAIDGALGARFLEVLKGYLEEPVTMLL